MINQQKSCLNDKRMARLVRNKTVAVVGPSQSIIGKGKGKFIDSHDLVVHFNYMFPLKEELFEDYGSRTDILYHCFCKRNPQEAASIDKLYDPDVTKDLSCLISVRTLWAGPPNASDLRDDVVAKNEMPHYIISDSFVDELKSEYSIHKPTLGIAALKQLLGLEPQSIYLTGFTVHKDSYYKGYNDSQLKYWKKGVPDQIGPHEVEQQRLTLRRFYLESESVLKIDDNLKEILEV